MTLDEAIEHAHECVVSSKDTKCASEHLELAAWLRELKSLRADIAAGILVRVPKNSIAVDEDYTIEAKESGPRTQTPEEDEADKQYFIKNLYAALGIPEHFKKDLELQPHLKECAACKGSGYVIALKEKCSECHGTGWRDGWPCQVPCWKCNKEKTR